MYVECKEGEQTTFPSGKYCPPPGCFGEGKPLRRLRKGRGVFAEMRAARSGGEKCASCGIGGVRKLTLCEIRKSGQNGTELSYIELEVSIEKVPEQTDSFGDRRTAIARWLLRKKRGRVIVGRPSSAAGFPRGNREPRQRVEDKLSFYSKIGVRELLISQRDKRTLRLLRHDGRSWY